MHYNERKRNFHTFLKIISTLLPALFWILLLLSFDSPDIVVITLLSAVVHELGHEVYLWKKTKKIRPPRGVLNGLKISCDDILNLSYGEEAIVYASGPMANIFASILFPLYSFLGDFAVYFALINLTTALSNLIPIRGYDGYGILSALLTQALSHTASRRICEALSFTFTLLLCTVSLYFIDRFGESYWIFFVFSTSLLSGISQSLKKHNYEK